MKKFLVCLVLAVTLMGSVAHAFEIGDYGEDVIAIHKKLGELGYYGSRAESPWGKKSVEAVKAVQNVIGWDVNIGVDEILTIDESLPQFQIKKINDIDEYLDFINNPGFTVFISVRDEANNKLKDSTKEKLKALGLKTEWTDRYRKPYIAVIERGTVIEELAAETTTGAPLTSEGAIGGMSYNIISSGYENDGGSNSSIKLDSLEYGRNRRGFNIVTVMNGHVIDSVSFDTCGEENATARR